MQLGHRLGVRLLVVAALFTAGCASLPPHTEATVSEPHRAEGTGADELRASDAQAVLATQVAVREEPRGLIITIPGSALFASNRATLLPAAHVHLDQVFELLQTTRTRSLTIEGHTNSHGSAGYNLGLSQRRADAVRDYIVERGYQADRVQARGLGEGTPVADNADARGRADNTRIEIVIQREPHASSQ